MKLDILLKVKGIRPDEKTQMTSVDRMASANIPYLPAMEQTRMLAHTLAQNTNPKFQKSKLLHFVSKMSCVELNIEDNQMDTEGHEVVETPFLEILVAGGKVAPLFLDIHRDHFALTQKYIEWVGYLDELSPRVPLYKVMEGNEPSFFTTYFSWDPSNPSVLLVIGLK
ncbi:unnamed protein product [Lactuca saligna]|uniref:Uncharacterized protein n=1 Tax=Lactuca saligna TaxID=75948 RepID=A0AA35VEP3_LACSI|nr:unnamed protein product [Lactuca saligna]